jgi:hypothetical protein
MTISSTANRTSTAGDGVVTAFTFPYLFFADNDLKVILVVDSTGVETVQTITTHYTVTGAGVSAGGAVTMVTEPASGETLVIIREEQITQGLDLVENDPFPSDLVEQQLDSLTMIAQQLDDKIDRSMVLSDGDSTGVDLTLPTPVALKTFRWNAALTALEQTDDPAVSATAAAVSAAAALVSEGLADTDATATAADAVSTAADVVSTAADVVTTAGEASALAPKYTFSTSTTDSDPGAGILRYNNATVASVTEIYMDNTTADTGNPDVAAWLLSWDSSTSTLHSQIRLVEPGTPANYAVFDVSDAVDSTGYVKLTVAHVDSNGTFGNTDSIRISNARTGDKGTTGSTGSTGATGATGATGPAGAGDVVGPSSATDGAVVTYDGTTGKLVKDGVTLGTVATLATGTSTGNVPLVGTKSSTETLAGLIERSTSAENVTGTDDTVTPTVAGVKEMIDTHSSGGFTLGTEVATTSGTAVTFTGIPAGTTMIVVMLEDVSFSSENGVVLTLGDGDGLETSGYVSTISKLGGTSAAISSTAGFDSNSSGAGDIFTIQYVLTLQNAGSFKWNMTVIGKYSTSQHVIGGGSKSLSAELTQVSISGGTFDAGSINIMYQ